MYNITVRAILGGANISLEIQTANCYCSFSFFDYFTQ